MLGVRGPFGNALAGRGRRSAATSIVVAGGIGLAPLRPASTSCSRRRADFGEVALLYGSRTPAELLYAT